jgi:hypothetical protein
LLALVLAAAVIAAAQNGIAALFFLFEPPVGKPGDPRADLAVAMERPDVPGPRLRIETVRGWPQNSGFRGSGSWAARLHFPSVGCWRVTGRVWDVRLAFVVNVAIR